MRLQEPVTRHRVNDCLLLHQILAVSLSARKLSGWEAPSSLLLWSAPNGLRSSCPYPSHIDKAQTAVYMPACGLVGGFLYSPLPFWGFSSSILAACSLPMSKLWACSQEACIFYRRFSGWLFVAFFLPDRKAVRRRVDPKNEDNLS